MILLIKSRQLIVLHKRPDLRKFSAFIVWENAVPLLFPVARARPLYAEIPPPSPSCRPHHPSFLRPVLSFSFAGVLSTQEWEVPCCSGSWQVGFAQVLFGSQSGGRLFRGRSITRVGTGGTGRSFKQTCFSSSALEAQAYSRERGKKNISALWSAGLRPRIQRRELKQTPGRWLKRHKLNFHIEHWKTVLLHALEELFSFYIWQPCSSYQRREMTCFTVVCENDITTVLSSFSIVKPLTPISFQDNLTGIIVEW